MTTSFTLTPPPAATAAALPLQDAFLSQVQTLLQLGLLAPLLAQLQAPAALQAGLAHYHSQLLGVVNQAYLERQSGNYQQWLSELQGWCQAPYRQELFLVLNTLFPFGELPTATERLIRWTDGHRLQSSVAPSAELPAWVEEQAVLTTAYSPLHWLLLGQNYTRQWLKQQGHEASNELMALVQLRRLGPAYGLACLTASQPPLQVKQALQAGLTRWFPAWGLERVEVATNEEWLQRAETLVPHSLVFEDAFAGQVTMIQERFATQSFVASLPRSESASELHHQLQNAETMGDIYPLLAQVKEEPVSLLALLTAAWWVWLHQVAAWQNDASAAPATAEALGAWLASFNQRLLKSIETAELHRLVMGIKPAL